MSRPTGPGGEVLAAGGVLLRWEGDTLAVAVIHRGRRRDWSFPKGHLEAGESSEEAALREVEEETGLRCRLLAALPSVRYGDNNGRMKQVDYWTMAVIDGGFCENDEVDELRWLGPPEAMGLLSYRTDREVLAAALATVGRDERAAPPRSVP